MPRGQTSGSAYERVRRQAVTALGGLHKAIRKVELELSMLRKQEEQLGILTGSEPERAGTARVDGTARTRGGRMDWRKVLTKLPKRFKASDVREVPGLSSKRSGEIFAAVTRWIDAGLVKRKERGVYERAE
jgi:hypothetical protein